MEKIDCKKQNKAMKDILEELKDIKDQIGKLLLLFPQESLSGYKNAGQIKKDYLDALNNFPPA